jgi:hypothetical protein
MSPVVLANVGRCELPSCRVAKAIAYGPQVSAPRDRTPDVHVCSPGARTVQVFFRAVAHADELDAEVLLP